MVDLNYDKFNLSEFEDYQVLNDLIKNVSQSKKRKIKKILIIGKDLLHIYPQLHKIYPNA